LVDDVDFGMAFGDACCWVDMVAPEVAAEGDCVLHGEIGKVLVAKHEDFALRGQEG
jgi:hypothetical protein